MTQSERQAQTAEQYYAHERRAARELREKYRKPERDIIAEVPEAAREEAERLVTGKVLWELALGSFIRETLAEDGFGSDERENALAYMQRISVDQAINRHRLAGALAVCAKEGLR